MARRGATVDILDRKRGLFRSEPIANAQELDDIEKLTPLQIDLRNGRLTAADSWVRRPGRQTVWNLGEAAAVVSLIAEVGPYAITSTGSVYRLAEGGLSRKLNGTVPVQTRVNYVIVRDQIVLAGGGRVRIIQDEKVDDLGVAPVQKAKTPTVEVVNVPGRIEPGTYRWMVVYVTADGRSAPGNHSAATTVGIDPPPSPSVATVAGGTTPSNSLRYRVSYVTTMGETLPSPPSNAIRGGSGTSIRVSFQAPAAAIAPYVTGVHVWREKDESGVWKLMGNALYVIEALPTEGSIDDGVTIFGEYDHLDFYGACKLAGSAKITLPSLDPTSEDGKRVIAKELYRKPDNDVAPWLHVETLGAYARDYTDQKALDELGKVIAVTDVGIALDQDTSESRPPYGTKYLAYTDDILIAAGYDDYTFRYSMAGDLKRWPLINQGQTQLDTGKIVGVAVIGREVLFFKRRDVEVWVVSGGALAFLRRQSLDKGALGGVVVADGSVFWLGDDHELYTLAKGAPSIIAPGQVRKDLRALTRPEEVYGLHFRKERIIRWFSPSDGRCFAYDYRNDIVTEDNEWTNGGWTFLPISSHGEWETTKGLKCFVGDANSTGLIDEWSDEHSTDRDKVIRCVRKFTVALSTKGKQGRADALEIRAKRGAGDLGREPFLELGYSFNQSPIATRKKFSLGVKGDTDPYVRMTNLGIGRELTIEIVETDAVPYLITNAFLTVKELGR